MKKTKHVVTTIALLTLALIVPHKTLAQITNPALSVSSSTPGNEFFSNLLSSILTTLLIFGVVAFLFLLVFGAYKWISAGGDKMAIQKAREHVTHALIGVIILLSAFAIYNLVGCFFGIGPCIGGPIGGNPPPIATPGPTTPGLGTGTPSPGPGSPTPSISPLCGQNCTVDADCGAGHVCWAEGGAGEQRHCYSDQCPAWQQTNCVCPPPTPTPTPTPKTWNFEVEAICENGATHTHDIYPMWIDYLPQTEHLISGHVPGPRVISISTSLSHVALFLTGTFNDWYNSFPLRGAPQSTHITYGTYSSASIPAALWTTSELEETNGGSYRIEFIAPTSWCPNPSSTPTPTPTPVQGCYFPGDGYCWVLSNPGQSCGGINGACNSVGRTCSTDYWWNDDDNCTLLNILIGPTESCDQCVDDFYDYDVFPSAVLTSSYNYCWVRPVELSANCGTARSGHSRLCACE